MTAQPQHSQRSAPRTDHLPCTVPCDLCEAPFQLPPEIAAQGVIYGLLVCTECVELNLEAQNYERTCQAN